MAENSKIEWTDHTINLWWGCAKVHTGCKNCYAEYFSDVRLKNSLWGEKQPRKLIISAFKELDKFQRDAKKEGIKKRVFIGSMCDIFENDKELQNPSFQYKTTSDLRDELFMRIVLGKYDNLIFLFLTKRPENIEKNYPLNYDLASCSNVWIGTSISDQDTADKYIPNLIMGTPAGANLFLSIEPQVGAIDLDKVGVDLCGDGEMVVDCLWGIGWVIQGGESGKGKRQFKTEWAKTIREQCERSGVPYFFKQIDKIKPVPKELLVREYPKF